MRRTRVAMLAVVAVVVVKTLCDPDVQCQVLIGHRSPWRHTRLRYSKFVTCSRCDPGWTNR